MLPRPDSAPLPQRRDAPGRRQGAAPGPVARPESVRPPHRRRPRLQAVAALVGPFETFRTAEWSIAFVGMLMYLLAVITFRWPIAPYGVGVMAFGVLVQTKRDSSPPFALGLLYILIWSALGMGLSEYREVSLLAWIELGKVVIIGLLMPQVLRTRKTVLSALLAHVALFTLYPARGSIINRLVGNTLQGRWTWNYIYDNPNDFAALTLFALGSAAALMFCYWRQRAVRLALMGLCGQFLFLIVMTQSRGVAIGLLAGFPMFLFYATKQVRKSFMVVAVVLIAATPMLVPKDVMNRYFASAMSDEDFEQTKNDLRLNMARGSTQERTEILKTGLSIARDNPLVGVGIGAYRYAHAVVAPQMGEKDTHNTYVNLAAESGLPALFLFVGLIALTFRACVRAIRTLRASQPMHAMAISAMLSALLAFLVASFFATNAKVLFLYVFMAFSYCLAKVLVPSIDVVRRPRHRGASPRRSGPAPRMTAPVQADPS